MSIAAICNCGKAIGYCDGECLNQFKQPLLSILIPSLESRKEQLNNLLRELNKQAANVLNEVEICVCVDNKELTTGAKRNKLLKMATGKYVVFFDDDDFPFKSYISSILEACKTDCDCIGMSGLITTDGKFPIKWHISMKYKDENIRKGKTWIYLRSNNHISPIKREIALQIGFPDKSNAEDSDFSKRLRESGLLKTEHVIKGMMYHYRFSKFNKEYK